MISIRQISRALAGAVVGILVLSGCSTIAPDAQPTAVAFRVCVLGADGGFGDHSINDSMYQAALQTQAEFGVKITSRQVARGASSDTTRDIANKLVKQGCSVFVASGSAAATVEALAEKRPGNKFVIVKSVPYILGTDSGISPDKLTNVKVVSFDSAQVGFMAGYLAASQTKTSVVGAFGSTLSQTEVALLAGFYQGVQKYNGTYGTNVKVLGLRDKTSDTWLQANEGQRKAVADVASTMIAQSADVLYPVVGDSNRDGTGLGAIDAIGERTDVSVIGSVTDWYRYDSAKTARSLILASALVGIQTQVAIVLGSALDATFAGGMAATYVGTLDNGGVTITGVHQIAYPVAFTRSVDQLKAEVLAGQIIVKSKLGG